MLRSGQIKSATSESYATHKNDYNMEQYLIHVRIKNIVTLAKIRLHVFFFISKWILGGQG